MLIVISCFLTIFFEAVIDWIYFNSLFQKKRRNSILEYAILYIVLFALTFYHSAVVNIVSFFLINFIYLGYQYRIKLISCFFYSLTVTVTMGVTEIISLQMVPKLILNLYETHDAISLITVVVVGKLFYYLILKVTEIIIKSHRGNDYSLKEAIPLCFIPICSLIIIMGLIRISYDVELNIRYSYLLVACEIFILLINLMVSFFYEVSRERNSEMILLELQLQKEKYDNEYYQLMLRQEEDKSILIHDIKKHLYAISSYIESNEENAAQKYIDSILYSNELQTSKKNSDNDLANSIISRYEALCKDNGIRFEVDIRKNALFSLADNEITSLLCNLYDNAYYAASRCDNPYIALSIKQKENSSFTVISLINSSNNEARHAKKEKSRKHGYGLKSIDKIAQNHGGYMNAYYDEEEREYHTVVIISDGNNA